MGMLYNRLPIVLNEELSGSTYYPIPVRCFRHF